MRFKQCNDSLCSPITYDVQIGGQITVPRAAHSIWINFSWTKRDSDPTETVSRRNNIYPERMSTRRLLHLVVLGKLESLRACAEC